VTKSLFNPPSSSEDLQDTTGVRLLTAWVLFFLCNAVTCSAPNKLYNVCMSYLSLWAVFHRQDLTLVRVLPHPRTTSMIRPPRDTAGIQHWYACSKCGFESFAACRSFDEHCNIHISYRKYVTECTVGRTGSLSCSLCECWCFICVQTFFIT
jgi:hypothetical protein